VGKSFGECIANVQQTLRVAFGLYFDVRCGHHIYAVLDAGFDLSVYIINYVLLGPSRDLLNNNAIDDFTISSSSRRLLYQLVGFLHGYLRSTADFPIVNQLFQFPRYQTVSSHSHFSQFASDPAF